MELFYLKFASKWQHCVDAIYVRNGMCELDRLCRSLIRSFNVNHVLCCAVLLVRVALHMCMWWLSLIRIHCSHPPMKFSSSAISCTAAAHDVVHKHRASDFSSHRMERNETKHFLSSSTNFIT